MAKHYNVQYKVFQLWLKHVEQRLVRWFEHTGLAHDWHWLLDKFMLSLRFFWPGPEASEQQTSHCFLTEDFVRCLTDREVLVLNLYPRVSSILRITGSCRPINCLCLIWGKLIQKIQHEVEWLLLSRILTFIQSKDCGSVNPSIQSIRKCCHSPTPRLRVARVSTHSLVNDIGAPFRVVIQFINGWLLFGIFTDVQNWSHCRK